VHQKTADNIPVTQYFQYIEDTGQDYSIDSVIRKKDFLRYNQDIQTNNNSVLWSKFILKSEYQQAIDLIIQIGNKRSSDFAEMFIFNSKDSLIKQAKSGYFELKENKEIKHEIGSKFMLSLEPGQVYTIYFKIKNISGFKPEFEATLYTKEFFNKKLSLRNLVQGMMQGGLWMIFLYNLFVFFYSRDKVYLYYAMYIISIALNFVTERGLFVEYSIPWFPKLDPFVFIIATGLASIAYFQFIRYFLDTKTKIANWDKAHIWVVRINILITIILLIVLLLSFNIPFSVNISNYLNLAGILYGFVFIFYLVKTRIKLARFFIAGALALAIGTIVSLYFLITKTPLGFDPKYFMNAGTIVELLIFSLGLGSRIRLMEESKQSMHLELIMQLQRNQSLREKVNRELEMKVKERTAEIELQNEEILSQTENLKSANEYLTQQKKEIEDKNEEILTQQKILERAHQNITDSIQYASRIQNVILPSENTLSKYFSGHFIWNQPKEIVSGDFYWYRYIEKNNKRYFAIAAADSTGHGVPGSLLSMLGISLLNEIVIRQEIDSAEKVLEILRNEVKTTFSYSDEYLLTRDGIDMAFCIIDLDTKIMQYSGANRPVIIFQFPDGGESVPMIELKPNKNPIGIHHKQSPFTLQTIQLEAGDIIYLFSDGYADQVGGFDGRKFYYKRFKELLESICLEEMGKQKEKIIDTYRIWTEQESGDSSYKQVDDILVMGIKI
jgi:serine phosphatase RsbU (regulator of sigma subunit)